MASIYTIKRVLYSFLQEQRQARCISQKPVNGDGDFTFSRSTAATRVNADGNIEKETQNLLLQSNSFDTTWSAILMEQVDKLDMMVKSMLGYDYNVYKCLRLQQTGIT